MTNATAISGFIEASLVEFAYSEAKRLSAKAESWEALSLVAGDDGDIKRMVALTFGASVLRQASGWATVDLSCMRVLEAEAEETFRHFSGSASSVEVAA